MSGLIVKHFEKILQGDISAADDYSEKLTCIARVGGKPETLNSAGAKALLKRLQKLIPFQEAEVLVNRATENYGVLAVQSSFAPFLSYACVAEKGKIIGATLYIYQPAQDLAPAVTPMPR